MNNLLRRPADSAPQRTMRRTTVAVAVLAAAAALTSVAHASSGPTSATASADTPYAVSATAAARIAWQPCTDPDFKGMDCGTLSAPVDYAHPTGAQVHLALVKRPASDPAERVGTLLMNDGSGGSSIEQLRYALRFGLGNSKMAARFDIIAMDPRGVGHSQGIDCTGPASTADVDDMPASQAQFDSLVARNKAFAAACLAQNGPLVTHMDMTSTARDFERLRIALDVKQLNWYGIDYSDLLARTYAQLYPGHLRTMLLDTAPDDTLPPVEHLADEMTTAEQAFDDFASWCQGDATCALHGQDVAAAYDRLIAQADQSPIPVKDTGQTLTGQDIQAATQDYLVIKSVAWPMLGQAISQALAGDATAFTPARDVDKTLNHTQVRAAACLDQPPAATTYPQIVQLERMAAELSPHLGGQVRSWTDMTGCLGWPTAAHAPVQSPVTEAPPALILESVHQSLSDYPWAFDLATQLPGSRVLSVAGDDYSTYIINPCVVQNADTYLTTRALPAPGTICN